VFASRHVGAGGDVHVHALSLPAPGVSPVASAGAFELPPHAAIARHKMSGRIMRRILLRRDDAG
jgi:hypothetical protein